MHQVLLIALLSINVEIDLTPLLARLTGHEAAPAVTCNLKIVGFRFVGFPKQRFEYGGTMYEIDESGFVELIADRRSRKAYRVNALAIPLPQGPADPFGFVEVRLPGAIDK